MARRQFHNSFKTIEDVISREKEFTNLRETLKNFNIVEEFSKIFPELSAIANAVKVEKKILYLSVDNSVWKSELNFRKSMITEKINLHFGEEILKSIKFL
jgi:hypothetical protein